MFSGNTSRVFLAEGMAAGKAESDRQKADMERGRQICVGKRTLRVRSIRRHENFFIRAAHPDFSGFALNGARVAFQTVNFFLKRKIFSR